MSAKMLADFYEQEGLGVLPDDIAQVILKLLPNATDRELQGGLIRAVAYADLTGQQLSASLTWDVITGSINRTEAH